MSHSRPLWPDRNTHFFSFKYIMDDQKQMTPIYFFFKFFFGRHRRSMRAVIELFEIYRINYLMKKIYIFNTNFIISRALFGVVQPKRKKLKLFFFILRWNGHIRCRKICFQRFFAIFVFLNCFYLNLLYQFFLSEFFFINWSKIIIPSYEYGLFSWD